MKAKTKGGEENPIIEIAPENADRFLANAMAHLAWCEAPPLEDIHSGPLPLHPLLSHQQRFNHNTQLAIMRNVTARMGSVLFTLRTLFDTHQQHPELPAWPKTATLLVHSTEEITPAGWSLTESSAPVRLDKWSPD